MIPLLHVSVNSVKNPLHFLRVGFVEVGESFVLMTASMLLTVLKFLLSAKCAKHLS